jgi:hypothetical protein
MPSSRATFAGGPVAIEWSSSRAGRRVLRTRAVMSVPSTGIAGADRQVNLLFAPLRHDRRHDRRGVIGLVAKHCGGVDVQQPAHLLGDLGEDLFGRALLRHQRRHAPQRGLPFREPGHLRARLGVRDRRRHQLGEFADLRLGVRRERRHALRRGGDHAPGAALNHDRTSDRRSDPQLPGLPRDRAGGAIEAVHPRRTAGLLHQRRDTHPLHGEPRAQGQLVTAVLAPHADSGHRPVRLVALQPGEVCAAEQPDLADDGLEHLRRRHTARNEGRHAPQRGLLVGEPAHLDACLGVRDRRGHELREGGDPRLRVRRQRLILVG